MKSYQYLILYQPNDKEQKTGEKAKIIKDVTTVLAKDEKSAAMQATRAIPADYDDRLDSVEVLVRPF